MAGSTTRSATVRLLAPAVAVAAVLTACGSPAAGSHHDGTRPAHSAGSSPTTVGSIPDGSTATATTARPTDTSATRPSGRTQATRGMGPTPALPLGGNRIFPAYRVVADYGAPGNDGLGVLGVGSPDQAADAIVKRAAAYRRFGKPVQPAMELLATVAQGSAGRDGDYSAAVSRDAVAAYLRAAKQHHMLLVLDFQPGRGDFLPQVKQFRKFLDDPWVGVGLDPEWKMGPHQVPGIAIGSSSAASINAVSSYLATIVRTGNLPQKLFVVHQFTAPMLPDRSHLVGHHELATVLHADGHGNRAVKQAVYHRLAFPARFATGFKLFLTQDGHMMSPAQVMALRPRPDLVTYE